MKSIADIDKNFKVDTKINKEDIKFYDADSAPFKIYGIYKDGERYRRMPEEVAKSVSEGVHFLHANTAGGRIRFVTDSSYVAISAKMSGVERMSHFSVTGMVAFDMYADNMYAGTFIPPYDAEDGFEGVINLSDTKKREITINFPLYSNVDSLYIGLQEGAILEEATPYKNAKPIVYYGSSITQGGCASRPGMSYQNIITRELDYDYINLGFSGSARAEDEMIDYIKNLDMPLFVYDYDYNAKNSDYLQATHEKMFLAVRKVHPDIPIIIMSRPRHYLVDFEQRRLEIIRTTYNNAIEAGDKNVYLITNKELTALCGNDGNVDGCHPTDFGFQSMANALIDMFRTIGEDWIK